MVPVHALGVSLGSVALALLWLFMGTVAWWFAFHMFRRVRHERNWPTVPGAILERGVGYTPGSTIPPGEPLRATFRYYPHVKYAYSVAGKEYVNDRLYLVGRTYGSGGVMQRLVDRLPNPVPVHYDPADPARSYLLVPPMWPVWISVTAGAVALPWGLLQLLVELIRG
jgi:hypothetical protein